MSFAREAWLLALPAVPLLWLLWLAGSVRASRRARSLTRLPMRGPAVFAALVLALAAASAIVAAAGPRWGEEDAFIPRRGADLFFVLDVSRSMGARDVDPSRLEASKAAIVETFERLGGDRAGLVIYAGDAIVRAPLTADLDAAARIVTTLQPGPLLVDAGSSAASGLDLALESFDPESEAGRLVVLISDGDDLGADPAATAARFASSGVGLLVAGAGTAAGAPVPVIDPATGESRDLLNADGTPVTTRLNEPLLRALAAAAGGQYVGSDVAVVPSVAISRMAGLASAQFDEREATLPIERSRWFAGAAVALALLATLAERFRPGRRAASLAVALLAAVAISACATDAYEVNEDAIEAYEAGDFDTAADLFLQAQAERPDDPEVSINLAAALHAGGRYDEAAQAARRALSSTSPRWRARAQASIGHHRFALGDLPGSLEAFKQALIEDPRDDESRHNYEVVLRLLQPPAASPTPSQQPGQSPTPGASPTPGENGEGDGGPTDPDATPTAPTGPPDPGDPAEPGVTGEGLSEEDVEALLSQYDAQIASLVEEAGEEPTAAEAFEILRLIEERSRIAALRGRDGDVDPSDY
jgi:Ca-activated chloride channel family protein